MSERRGNIFRFRRLKWGDPERLRGLRAIGFADESAQQPPTRRRPSAGTLGLLLTAAAAGLAIGLSVFGWF
jgi:hypothetical protein